MALSLEQSLQRFREAMLRRDARTLRELTAAYRVAYKFIKRDAERLLDRITRAQESGESVSPFWLSQEDRYRSLLIQIQRRINSFSVGATQDITRAQAELAAMGSRDAQRLISAAYPIEIAAAFDLLPADAIESLVGVLSDGSPLADLLGELGPQAQAMISRTLINGIASGMSIRKIARGIDNALGNNLTRALNIARTESLRSYREANRQTFQQNSDMVKGWVWLCSFSERTCAACFAMHGTVHSNDESLNSHCQCRCTMGPITKSWRDLGINLDEPPRNYGDADAWIRQQPEEVQQRIFGKTGAAAYRDGRAKLQDFVGTKVDPRWGVTRYIKPLREMHLGQERRAA